MKNLTTACMIIAMSMGFASASFAFGEDGGETCLTECPDDPKPKGNNGWGNGGDGDNAGTTKGGTRDTKMDDTLR